MNYPEILTDAAAIVSAYEGQYEYPAAVAAALGSLADSLKQEWRLIVFTPSGERVEHLDSGWYDESTARSLLNREYPGPTPTGFYFILQARWVTEAISC